MTGLMAVTIAATRIFEKCIFDLCESSRVKTLREGWLLVDEKLGSYRDLLAAG